MVVVFSYKSKHYDKSQDSLGEENMFTGKFGGEGEGKGVGEGLGARLKGGVTFKDGTKEISAWQSGQKSFGKHVCDEEGSTRYRVVN